MKALEIRPSLMALIEDAKYEWELSEDGRRLDVGTDLWELFDRWELRGDGSVLHSSKLERSEDFQFEGWYASWEYAERWLAKRAGTRARRPAPAIMISGFAEDLDSRCALSDEVIDGSSRIGLRIGSALVAAFGDVRDAAYASHLMPEDVETIIASYRHPEGKPLFGLDRITPPSLRS